MLSTFPNQCALIGRKVSFQSFFMLITVSSSLPRRARRTVPTLVQVGPAQTIKRIHAPQRSSMRIRQFRRIVASGEGPDHVNAAAHPD
jgi:hypothetical protein